MARVDVRSIRREQILEAAEHLVAQRGWAQTSFAEICREAGVSNGVLTYHFKDKEDLLLALYERTSCTWKEHFDTECPGGFGEDVNPFLPLVREAAAAVEADPQVFLLLLRYLSEAPDHPDVRERIQGMFAEMRAKVGAEIAAAWQTSGIAGDAEVAAGVLQSAMAGFLIMRAALGLKVPPEEMARMMNLFVQTSSPYCPSAAGCAGVTTATSETST
jgi:TetR/AcrR family transcriptional repressor of bet genes